MAPPFESCRKTRRRLASGPLIKNAHLKVDFLILVAQTETEIELDWIQRENFRPLRDIIWKTMIRLCAEIFLYFNILANSKMVSSSI